MVFLKSPVHLDIMVLQVVFWLFFFFAANLILKGGKKDVLSIMCFFMEYSKIEEKKKKGKEK